MADVPGSSFDRALNLINRAVGMLCGGNNSESQREGSSSNDRFPNVPVPFTFRSLIGFCLLHTRYIP